MSLINESLFKEFTDAILETKKEINNYINETKSIWSLYNFETVGKIADYGNDLDIILNNNTNNIIQNNNVNISNMSQQCIKCTAVISKINKLYNIINKMIDLIEPENIIKEAVLGRSFTYVDNIKHLRGKIISRKSAINDIYEKNVNDIVNKLKTELNADNVNEFISNLENKEFLFRLINIPIIGDNTTALKYMDEIKTSLMIPNYEISPTMLLLMRTYPKFEKVTNYQVDNVININTGQVINYDLRGLTSAGWVAQNKLGENINTGLSSAFVRRLNLIQNVTGKINKSDISGQQSDNKISFGGDIYTTMIMPSYLEFITIGEILGENILKNIVLTPPNMNIDNNAIKAKSESYLLRIKTNLSSAINKWIRTPNKNDYESPDDFINKFMSVAKEAIKEAFIITEDLLLIYSILVECYKRFEIYIGEKLELKTADDLKNLLNKQDLLEYIQLVTVGAANDINRQPSPLDNL